MTTHDFHSLTISAITRLTPTAVSLAFDIPADLKQAFTFLPGQYLTLRATIGGEEVRRSYSICSAAHEPVLRVGVKEVVNGTFSTYANQQLAVGDTVDVMPPMGNFTASMDPGHYVAFAAGSGITPILSIISSGLESQRDARFTLFFGNRSVTEVMFAQELALLQERFSDRLKVVHRMSGGDAATAEAGRIDGIAIERWSGEHFDASSVSRFFLCGPEEMIMTTKRVLENKGVASDKILFELFTVPTQMESAPAAAPAVPAQDDFTGMAKVTVVIDDEEVTYDLATDGKSILDAGLAAGADLPFACKGGVCCTCRAKVVEGRAHMTQNFSLGDDEIADGFILTCQSHPDTATVKVDYDA